MVITTCFIIMLGLLSYGQQLCLASTITHISNKEIATIHKQKLNDDTNDSAVDKKRRQTLKELSQKVTSSSDKKTVSNNQIMHERSAITTQVAYSETLAAGPITFANAAYDSDTSSLFVGATTPSSLASVMQFTHQQAANPIASMLAPVHSYVNGSANADNPIYNTTITNLVLTGTTNTPTPVVTVQTEAGANVPSIYILEQNGTNVITSPTLTDASSTAATGQIAALAANRKPVYEQLFFAAIPDASSATNTWATSSSAATTNRGIAVVTRSGTTLAQVGSAATAISLLPGTGPSTANPVAFMASGATTPMFSATLGDAVSLVWDEPLNKVYVALTDVGQSTHASTANGITEVTTSGGVDGGAVSILIGSLDAQNQLTLAPILNNASNSLLDTTNKIIGFYAPHTNTSRQYRASAKNIGIMHTSTGYDYLIVNGGVVTDNTPNNQNTWIYALPLVAIGNSNSGQLANVTFSGSTVRTNFTTPAASSANLYVINPAHGSQEFNVSATTFTYNEIPAVVGADPRYINITNATSALIHAMEIIGDSVYVATDQGIWYSSALFDATGQIIAWTPWQSIGGVLNLSAAQGAFLSTGFCGINTNDTTIMYTARADNGTISETNPADSVRSSIWADSTKSQINDDGSAGINRGLTDLIATYFPASKGGVIAALSFDQYTRGFATGKFSMLGLIGYDTVALVEVMQNGNPTKTFTLGSTFIVYKNSALTQIAPLTSLDVLRSTNANEGFIYVSGLGGVCRLEISSNTNRCAWNSATGLASVAALTTAQFNAIPASSTYVNTLSIHGHASYIEAITTTGFICSTDIIGTVGSTVNNLTLVTGGLSLPSKVRLIATQNDLLLYPNTTNPSAFGLSGRITTTATPLKLSYVSTTRGYNSPQGNLYVLLADNTQNNAQITRFYIDSTKTTAATAIQKIANDRNPLCTINTYRENSSMDGQMLFTLLGNSTTPLINLLNARSSINKFGMEYPLDSTLDINNELFNAEANPPIITADGSRITTGTFGALVNE